MNKHLKFFLFTIIISGFLTGGYFYIHRQIFKPVGYQSKEQNFIVKKGESLKEIGERLEKEGLVNRAYWFKFYVLTKGWAARLQAGKYTISPTMNIPEISRKMVGGEAMSSDILITIPEGFTIRQIDVRLAKAGLIEKDELANFQLTKLLLSYGFPQNSGSVLVSNLEGFLFPDTYRFDRDSRVEDIIKKMTDNFDKKLTKDLRDKIKRDGKTIFEIAVLASIIQNEAMTAEEMPVIAGIFYNRLKIDMALQSDATINYITGKNLRQPTLKDIKVNSPYNTYLNKGLPPGPISNPGLDAIKAAVYPQETNYLFFLHPKNGPAVFSQTLKEHNLNKAKYLP